MLHKVQGIRGAFFYKCKEAFHCLFCFVVFFVVVFYSRCVHLSLNYPFVGNDVRNEAVGVVE